MNQDRKHSHYFKPCPFEHVDIYRVLHLFNVTDPCLQHAVKKLLVAGQRGAKVDAGWNIERDVQEAIDSLSRFQEMRREEADVPVAVSVSVESDQPLPVRIGVEGQIMQLNYRHTTGLITNDRYISELLDIASRVGPTL